jgi:tRNA A-37 threonylcarbamoyl transferase component Bud32
LSIRVERVSQLFESIAVETPSSVRDRARELSGRFLDSRSALPLAPGDVAGNYEVLDVLGAGGQAVVYRAKHRQIGRHVALKVPRREVGDRLLREAQLAARLEHASIVRVEDIQLEGAVPFMVLELCERGSLDDLLEQHPQGLPVELVQSIAVAILGALSFAHSEGVVHRDVKPANILFDRMGTAKVADFGIGTMSAADGLSVSVELSQLSLLAGTPLYVAPEQENPALRVNGRLDGRADLFSFGKVLFQMLTGASPRTIRPPSRLRKVLDPAWDDFVFKLLEERPEDRFPSADAALAFLPLPSAPSGVAPPPASTPSIALSSHPVAPISVKAVVPNAPVVVVAPRTGAPAAEPVARPEPRRETPWQEQARITCRVFAGFYVVGLWFAMASLFVTWSPFVSNLYVGAFGAAAGFCMVEARRASRAKNPTTGGILGVCIGAGLAFVGSAAGVHASLHYANENQPEMAIALTLFLTLPIQALGFILAWVGHEHLAPLGELAATPRELALAEAALLTLDALLVGVAYYISQTVKDPLAVVPVVGTISVVCTIVMIHVGRLRLRRRGRLD